LRINSGCGLKKHAAKIKTFFLIIKGFVGITKPRKKWKALLSIDSEHKRVKIFLEYPPNSLIFNEKFLGGLERPAMWDNSSLRVVSCVY